MLLRSLQLSVKNLRGISRVISQETCFKVPVQHYGRFAPRRPAAIVNEDELFDIEENTTPKPPKVKKIDRIRLAKSLKNEQMSQSVETLDEPVFNVEDEIGSQMGTDTITKASSKIHSKPKGINVQKSKKSKPHKAAVTQNNDDGEEPEDNKLFYTQLYENEKIMSSIMLSLKSNKKRKKNDQILVEGKLFIKDAIEAGVVPETIIFSRWDDVKDLAISNKVTKVFKVPYRTIQLWSTLTTSPGIMGIFKKPGPVKKSKESLPITIICDNIRDPGNMGTILRAAAGVGCEKIILTKGCVDFWSSKVLRSAAGAHFRIPIHGSMEWTEIKKLLPEDAQVYVADNNAGDNSYAGKFDENYDWMEENEEDTDESSDDEKKMKKQQKRVKPITPVRISDLPVVPYYSVDFTKNEAILIVGGETEGISHESYKLVEDRRGVRVNVPLTNGIDSLNAGMALGIVAFEVKRQFLLIQSKLNELSMK